MTVVDNRGSSCDWYNQDPDSCGFFDSKGDKCTFYYGPAADCDGAFKADEACCVCEEKKYQEKKEINFCCTFADFGNQKASCDLFLGAEIVDNDSNLYDYVSS